MLWKPQTKAKGGRGKIHNFMLARDFLGLQKTPLVILQFEKKKKKKKKRPFASLRLLYVTLQTVKYCNTMKYSK